ncbi:McrB family protein [Psychromonas hadalis]|uniref:McrB family protein n=1 Tax=Psychromonas hadalis TaxID=211669 RepID=UPI0003B4480C|nr:AAA family ATPase [Psychromonas hadalis]
MSLSQEFSRVKSTFSNECATLSINANEVLGVLSFPVKRGYTDSSSSSNVQLNLNSSNGEIRKFFPILENSENFTHTRAVVDAFYIKQGNASIVEGDINYRRKIVTNQQGEYPYIQLTFGGGIMQIRRDWLVDHEVIIIRHRKGQDVIYSVILNTATALHQGTFCINGVSQSKKPSVYLRTTLEKGKNKIYYGAPGTGKSYKIEAETAGAHNIKTVFHPDTQYSDFVGALKPKMEQNTAGDLVITYQFRPGPYTKALIKALEHPTEQVYLIIEEINRAPAAAVFGELFQLLDRDEFGNSSYQIDAADPDMLEYINQRLRAKSVTEIGQLTIPSNLSLLATMNSSDQAVMPLDTAFKRRWSFEYLPINFNNSPDKQLKLLTTAGIYNISWKDFATKIVNSKLKAFNVAEDRLIGPFFLNNTDLGDDWDTARSALCGKLFVYLWDDVLRHKVQDRKRLFNKNITTYGDLHASFMAEGGVDSIFSDEVNELIINHGTKEEV